MLEKAIVVGGMSGSPIYLDGKLAGAYAYGVEEYEGERVKSFELALRIAPEIKLASLVGPRFRLRGYREAVAAAVVAPERTLELDPEAVGAEGGEQAARHAMVGDGEAAARNVAADTEEHAPARKVIERGDLFGER